MNRFTEEFKIFDPCYDSDHDGRVGNITNNWTSSRLIDFLLGSFPDPIELNVSSVQDANIPKKGHVYYSDPVFSQYLNKKQYSINNTMTKDLRVRNLVFEYEGESFKDFTKGFTAFILEKKAELFKWTAGIEFDTELLAKCKCYKLVR